MNKRTHEETVGMAIPLDYVDFFVSNAVFLDKQEISKNILENASAFIFRTFFPFFRRETSADFGLWKNMNRRKKTRKEL